MKKSLLSAYAGLSVALFASVTSAAPLSAVQEGQVPVPTVIFLKSVKELQTHLMKASQKEATSGLKAVSLSSSSSTDDTVCDY